MPRLELQIADGFYISQSTPLIEKRVVNLYPVIPQASAGSPRALFGTPGIKQFSNINNDGVNSRGSLVFSDGIPYRVIGNTLYSFNSGGTATSHGSITGSSDVSMASNGINIAIQDPDGDSYFFTPSTNTLELNNGSVFLSFGQAKTVTFKDGFYVYTTSAIFFSSSTKTVNDGKTFDALDFADAEISPDLIVKGINDHNQLYILGKETTEVYRTIVTTGFPFERIPGAIIPKGCQAPNSAIDFDQSFVFLGGGKDEKAGIWRVIGSSAKKISTSSVDQLIQSNSDAVIEKTRAYSYSENGNYFAVFTVGDHTFVYDATTSNLSGKPEWHERQTGITNGTGFRKWRAIHGVVAFGSVQVGDDRSGLVGDLDFSTFTEYGNDIERFFTTKPFIDKGEHIFSHELELYMRTGIGDSTTPDPQIRMDYSDNGSMTFNSEISKSMGKVGEYNTEVKWKRMGRIPNSRVMRWKTTAAVPIEIYSLFANAEGTESG